MAQTAASWQALAAPPSQLVVKHTFLDIDETSFGPQPGAAVAKPPSHLRRVRSDSILHAMGQDSRYDEGIASMPPGGVEKLRSAASDDETAASDVDRGRHSSITSSYSRVMSTDTAAPEHGPSPDHSPLAVLPSSVEQLLAENARLAMENQQLRQQCQGQTYVDDAQQQCKGQGHVDDAQACGEVMQTQQMQGMNMIWVPCNMSNIQWMMPWQMSTEEPAAFSQQPFEPASCMSGSASCMSGSRRPAGRASWAGDSERMPAHVQRHAAARRAMDDEAAGLSVTDVKLEDRTTVMMRNLPNNYTQGMLLDMLNGAGFSGDYDFVYLPMDFRTNACLGYAFVNLIKPSIVPRFWKAFDGYTNWSVPSGKVGFVSWCGPHQGADAHVERYRNSPVMHESVPDAYKPLVFRMGMRIAFPPPTKKPRVPRVRNQMRASP